MEKVLVIEDDKNIAELIALHLKELPCEVSIENNGRIGYENALQNEFDLLILDLMLPAMSGLEICKQIRREKKYTPILMLTAKSEEADKIAGLEIGADDYLTKPFSVRELIARVKAILRRTQAVNAEIEEKTKKLQFKDLVIDVDNRLVTIQGKRIDLSPKEFDLLYLLAKRPGRSYSRQQLLDTIWGYQFDGFEHTVNSHINRLRAKIEEDMTNPQYVLTTWGVGYRFNDAL